MPVDLADLFESAPAPDMHVDVDRLLVRARRRRLRRRAGRSVAVLAALAVAVPGAVALRLGTDGPPAPAVAPPSACLFAGSSSDSGAGVGGTPWLDSGAAGAVSDLRVQVHTDSCRGLAVVVTAGAERPATSVSTTGLAGRPDHAFWAIAAVGGGVDRMGRSAPAGRVAAVLLPSGQRVCGSAVAPVASDPSAEPVQLARPQTVPAGDGWSATFGTLPSGIDPESVALRVCDGDRVVSAALRPVGSPVPTTATVDEAEGFVVLPLDAYWYSQREAEELASARHVRMVLCLRDEGVSTAEGPSRVIPDPPYRRFGLWRMSDARRWGYVDPASPAKRAAVAANGAPAAPTSPEQVRAAERCAREDPVLRVLDEQPSTGPWESAVSAAETAAQSSPAWRGAVDDWAECMEGRGIAVDREDVRPEGLDTSVLDAGRVRAQDVALAVADVGCKERTRYVHRVADLLALAEAPWIETYRDRYEEQRAGIDRRLALARQVLQDAGL